MAQNDGALGALLVEHIGDIEAAVAYVTESIDPLLWKAAAEILTEESASWGGTGNFDPDSDTELWIMPADWATEPSLEMGYDEDAWFSFSISDAKEDADVTSLASFLGAGGKGNGTALAFEQNMLKGRKWKGVLAQHENAVQAIREAGFLVEQREGRIEIPVILKRAELAAALTDEDTTLAFGPLRDALKRAAVAKPHFDALVAAAREVAYV